MHSTLQRSEQETYYLWFFWSLEWIFCWTMGSQINFRKMATWMELNMEKLWVMLWIRCSKWWRRCRDFCTSSTEEGQIQLCYKITVNVFSILGIHFEMFSFHQRIISEGLAAAKDTPYISLRSTTSTIISYVSLNYLQLHYASWCVPNSSFLEISFRHLIWWCLELCQIDFVAKFLNTREDVCTDSFKNVDSDCMDFLV